MRHASVRAGTIVGIVNYSGEKDHPYGDVEFLGPLPDNIGVEWVGKSAKSLQEELDKDKPTVSERVGVAAHAVKEALTPSEYVAHGGVLHEEPKQGQLAQTTHVEPVEPVVPMTAARLLAADKAGDLKYFTFVKEAKRILGKNYPESEEKPAILKALEKKAG